MLENAVVEFGDDVDRLLQIERVERHVADIGHLDRVEGRGPVAML